MKTILFTDTHFGVKNNSMTWWEHQKSFIYHQLIPFIQSQDRPIRLVHCGDVFDSRTSINTIILKNARQAFIDLCDLVDEFIIVAGNHDFGLMTSDEYCTPETILEGTNIQVVSKEILTLGNDIFIPWYCMEGEDITGITARYKGCRIFTHTDLVSTHPRCHCPVYSGHIHYPYFDHNINNLGSCYPLTFADANQDRYFYELNGNKLTHHKVTGVIQFHRLFNEEIKKTDITSFGKHDYFELYIKAKDLPLYTDTIRKYMGTFAHVGVIPQPDNHPTTKGINPGKLDIDGIISNTIPPELRPILEEIKKVQL